MGRRKRDVTTFPGRFVVAAAGRSIAHMLFEMPPYEEEVNKMNQNLQPADGKFKIWGGGGGGACVLASMIACVY